MPARERIWKSYQKGNRPVAAKVKTEESSKKFVDIRILKKNGLNVLKAYSISNITVRRIKEYK